MSEEYADLKHPVPCLFLPNKNVAATSKIVMYFHGNAEDVGLAAEMLDYIRYMMHVSYLSLTFRFTFSLWSTQATESTTELQTQNRFWLMPATFSIS